MSKQVLKKAAIISISIFIIIYLLFLILPFFLSAALNAHKDQIESSIKQSSGFDIKLEKMQIITTPKLTAGIKVGKIEAFLPTKEKFMEANNFQIKLSLLPLLARKIEVDSINTEDINIDLKVNRDGKFLIENHIPKSEQTKTETISTPFFKLSNHLPNITIKKHSISFINAQNNKKYTFNGQDTKISDFILDKKIRISSSGDLTLDNRKQIEYNIKILNTIMPDIELNELVFNPQPQEKKEKAIKINIIEIFEAIHQNQLNAKIDSDINVHGEANNVKLKGYLNIDDLFVAINNQKLPNSNVDLIFKNNKININSNLYSGLNELTKIEGNIKAGKKPTIDIQVKSNANLNNLCKLSNSVATSLGIKDLQTLSANGIIDADFNIKSNMKKVDSSGHLKIPNANLKYGLYNIVLSNINTDVRFDDNIINIIKAGFNIQGQPINIHGTIKHDSTADLYVYTEKLSLKNLILASGQGALLKDNIINSGTLSLNVSIVGKLNSAKPKVDVSIDNLNIKNIPSKTTLLIPISKINITSDQKTFRGSAQISATKIINPAATVSAPKITVLIEEKTITVNPSAVTVDKINFDTSGVIKNYLSEKMTLDFKTHGDINSQLNGHFNSKNQNLNLTYSIPEFCTVQIPGFTNSKLKARGHVAIVGNAVNPILKGKFIVPLIAIPDMFVTMNDMIINLNGPMFTGAGSLSKFTSGGIIANNLTADFLMQKEMFYLKKIVGEAFSGQINGSIAYNMDNGKTNIHFDGKKMNATSAIEGAMGIKNALSGTLSFNTNISLQGIEYNEMIKSLKGYFKFTVDDGAFGKIGRLENFLNAQNILANSILRAAVNNITAISTIKDTATFKYIKGEMTFNNGWANIASIKTSGPTMAYYINGRYNILNSTTNVIILGRLSSNVVALLGPLGDLSVDKITSYIPKFGALTSAIIKNMTSDPSNENTALIPILSSGNKSYKDFKVVFNGGIESQSSVKSFKWLSKGDTSAIDFKSTIGDVKKQFTDIKKQSIDLKDSAITDTKNKIDETKKQIQNTKDELKNLFKF